MSDKKPTLCIVAGPNGSGKTTTTVQLLNDEWTADSLYINPDNIAQETFGDWNSPAAVLKAAEMATQQRYKCESLSAISTVVMRCLSPRSSHAITSRCRMQPRLSQSLTAPTSTTTPLMVSCLACSIAPWTGRFSRNILTTFPNGRRLFANGAGSDLSFYRNRNLVIKQCQPHDWHCFWRESVFLETVLFCG